MYIHFIYIYLLSEDLRTCLLIINTNRLSPRKEIQCGRGKSPHTKGMGVGTECGTPFPQASQGIRRSSVQGLSVNQHASMQMPHSDVLNISPNIQLHCNYTCLVTDKKNSMQHI